MSMALAEAFVAVRADTSRVRGDLSSGLRASEKDAQKSGKRLGAALSAGLAGAVVALASFGRSSVGAFVESEQAQAGLARAFEKFPKLADTNKAALDARGRLGLVEKPEQRRAVAARRLEAIDAEGR